MGYRRPRMSAPPDRTLPSSSYFGWIALSIAALAACGGPSERPATRLPEPVYEPPIGPAPTATPTSAPPVAPAPSISAAAP
jgi:hypothetical protein